MNSNNLELSLIENEIEKISSRYHLQQKGMPSQGNSTVQSHSNLQMSQQKMNDHQEGLQMAMKSPSVLTFGGTINNYGHANHTTAKQHFFSDPQNPLQELTLTKSGALPFAKDLSNLPKINPKDLSNEELEFIIKTGKLPPRLDHTQNPTLLKNGNVGHSTVNYDKENNYSQVTEQQQQFKHMNSPKQVNQQNTMQQHQLLMSQVQPIQNNSYLDNSGCNKTMDITQGSSSAASQAIKALQEKIKTLENQNQLLEDKLHIVESQGKEQQQRLQQKLKEEMERYSTKESHMKEELQILKRQLESAENQKLRHLEENSSERENWRLQYQKLESANALLKQQIEDQLEKYGSIEDTIRDIKRREQSLRERYEQEVEVERDRSKEASEEVEQAKRRYEEMRDKVKHKNQMLEKENAQIKEERQQEATAKERERQKAVREAEKWKRECQMLREEMSIMGGDKKNTGKESKQKTNECGSGITPKTSSVKSGRKLKSPQKQEDKFKPLLNMNQTIDTNVNFQSIDIQDTKKSQKSVKKSESKRRNNSNTVVKKHESAVKQSQIRAMSSERKNSSGRVSSVQKYKKSRVKKDQSQKKKTKEQQMNSVQSQPNLISINTKAGKAENVFEDSLGDSKGSMDNKDYIFIENNASLHKQNLENNRNQFKRPSVDSMGTVSMHFGLSSTTSDYGALLYSQQSEQPPFNPRMTKPLDLQDFSKDQRQSVDNEIFYLEREIFDYNQQYKTLLSQQSNPNTTVSNSYQGGGSVMSESSQNTTNLNQKLRQIAQMLEEKSERLFDLKKQQQQILLQESYGSNKGEGNKAYQIKMSY